MRRFSLIGMLLMVAAATACGRGEEKGPASTTSAATSASATATPRATTGPPEAVAFYSAMGQSMARAGSFHVLLTSTEPSQEPEQRTIDVVFPDLFRLAFEGTQLRVVAIGDEGGPFIHML